MKQAVHFESIKEQWELLPRTFSLVWKAAHYWTIAWAVLLVVQGLLPVTSVYLTRALVNSLIALGNSDKTWENLRPAIGLVFLMVMIIFLQELLGGMNSWVRMAQSELIQDHLSGLIHEQATSLDLAFYDSPDYYDRLHRARVDALTRPAALLENVGALVQNSLTLAAMAVILFSFGPWLPLLLVLGTLPALWVLARYALDYHRWRKERTTLFRRASYFDWMLTLRTAASELRLFELGNYFRGLFQETRKQLRTELLELTRSQAFAELAASLIGLGVMSLGLIWMIWRTWQGLISLGDLAMYYQAFNQGQNLMRSLLQNAGQIYRNSLFLQDLFEFLALTPQVVDPPDPVPVPAPLRQGLRFENVSFRYPESERVVLQNFDLNVAAGQIVALVGENGAGKSTLIKLLCRFYDPTEGHICLDGVDLRRVSLAGLRRQIGILFQEPTNYHATAAENIAYSDLASSPGMDRIETAAAAAGADGPISRLPLGYSTLMGKWFGGSELSVGEWQRVALARAFLRQASILVLDEPTSAMDTWAEADWLSRFRTLAAGRTAILITHRFTTAMQADVIHVVADGHIVESGTHAALMASGGRYAQAWTAQVREGENWRV